ncbi:MAG: hypothetical protein DMD81_13175 [Candidatus Rokuibacteriota bacterium]|nr:MAG: hypothetical protein DMD81_13175 [Candidatus Rokubacteria bacterium]
MIVRDHVPEERQRHQLVEAGREGDRVRPPVELVRLEHRMRAAGERAEDLGIGRIEADRCGADHARRTFRFAIAERP